MFLLAPAEPVNALLSRALGAAGLKRIERSKPTSAV